MKAVIMAGGKGKRLSEITGDLPKPMMKIHGIPILERTLMLLKEYGIIDVIITIGYGAERIESYFGDGSGKSPCTGKTFGLNISYFREDKPLGSAGAIFKIKDRLSEDFLLLNADMVFDINLNKLIKYHMKKGGLVTLFTHPNDHPFDSGLVVADGDGAVTAWYTKEDTRPKWYKNRVNAGVHVVSPNIFSVIDSQEMISGEMERIDLDRDVLRPLAGKSYGKQYAMYCYDSSEYIKDCGTVERFYEVEKDLEEERICNGSKKNRAIFLDRDGTLNVYKGFLKNIDELELVPGVGGALRKINKNGFLAIIVTNQPVIARGELTEHELEEMHNKLETMIGLERAYLDDIYVCPHHPDKGFEGERSEYKIRCRCRKPEAGMLIDAALKYNIDFAESWIVGDGEADILAGKEAGVKTCLLVGKETNCSGSKKYDQDFEAENLLDFVDNILKI